MRRFTVLFLLSVVLLCTRAIRAQDSRLSESILPVYLVNDYLIIVRGSIGGLEKRNLLIDTGANPTVITPDLAKKLHLSGSREQLQAVGHNMNSQVVFVPNLQVGPIEVQHLRVLVQDLTELDRRLGLHLDALVGLDVLSHSSFRIDYHAKKMFFGPPPPLSFSAAIRWAGYMACIDTHVNGQAVPLLLDTGAANVTLFSQRISGLADKSGPVWNNTSLAGHFTLRQLKLNSLETAGSDLGPKEVFVSDSTNAARYPYEGLLSLGSERFRQIAFDFEHQVFSWDPVKSKSYNPRARDSSLALVSPETTDPASGVEGQCTGDPSGGNPSSCDSPAAFTSDSSTR